MKLSEQIEFALAGKALCCTPTGQAQWDFILTSLRRLQAIEEAAGELPNEPDFLESWRETESIRDRPKRFVTDYIDTLRTQFATLLVKSKEDARDAERYRKIVAVRKAHVGIPCACEFANDEITLTRTCDAHRAIIDSALAATFRPT